jgi:branched-chain amino acid transport system permease protein
MQLQLDPGLVIVLLRETLAFLAIYGIYVLSLNLEAGYLGLPQFGKVMFLALGGFAVGGIATWTAMLAYEGVIAARLGFSPVADAMEYCRAYQYQAVAVINEAFKSSLPEGLAFFAGSVVLAAVLAGAFGLLAAWPAIRLREDYLGILLLVSAEIVRVVTVYTPQLACGVYGRVVPDPFAWMGDGRPWGYLAALLAFLLLAFIVLERLCNSPFGRALRAIRDAETAAAAFGKDAARFRARVFVVASALSGIAGALLAFYMYYTNMGQFTPVLTFIAWAMLVVGGMGNNAGALLGVAIYIATDRLLTVFKESIVGAIVAATGAKIDPVYFQYMAFGIAIILILIFRPQGLVGEKPARTLPRETLERARKGLKFK